MKRSAKPANQWRRYPYVKKFERTVYHTHPHTAGFVVAGPTKKAVMAKNARCTQVWYGDADTLRLIIFG